MFILSIIDHIFFLLLHLRYIRFPPSLQIPVVVGHIRFPSPNEWCQEWLLVDSRDSPGFNPYRSHPYENPPFSYGKCMRSDHCSSGSVWTHHWYVFGSLSEIISYNIPHYVRRNTMDLRYPPVTFTNKPTSCWITLKQVLGTTFDTGNAFAVNRSPAAWISPTRHWRIWGASKT